MDRTKEEQQEEKKDDKESMEKSNKTILQPDTTTITNILAASTDDDISTESSDTLESWTLVTDKKKFIEPHMAKDNDDNRIDIFRNSEPDEDDLEEHEKNVEQQHLQDSLNDVTNDDLSDGISIISESESVGRISPHPYLRDHLHDLSFHFSTTDNMDDEILYRLRQETPIVLPYEQAEQQLRQRRKSSGTADTIRVEQHALQKTFQTVSLPLNVPPLMKRGLQGIFFVGVGLAILAIIGKIVNPTWQPLAGVKQSADTSAELEQKVNDMELQNNLMRAEIDLLNKQVKYLNSFKDPQQHKGKYKEIKTFQAWSGIGDSLKPVDITKEDLRRPFKCPDGSYVEFANMCIEQRPQHEPSLVDQFGHVVGDLKEQSETFKTFEKVAGELHGFQDNTFEQWENILTEDRKAQKQAANEYIKNKPIYQPPEDANQKHQQAKTNAESKHQEGKQSFGKDHNPETKDNPTQSHDLFSHETFENIQDNLKAGLEILKENFFKFSDYSKESFDKFRDDPKEAFEKLRDKSKVIFKKFLKAEPNAESEHDHKYEKKSFGKDNNPENEDNPIQSHDLFSHETLENVQDNLKAGLETLKENFFKFSDYSKESFEKFRDDPKQAFEKLRDKSKVMFKKFLKVEPNSESEHDHKYDKKSFGKENNPENNDNPTTNHDLNFHETLENVQDTLKVGLGILKENFFKFSDYSKKTYDKFRDESKEPLEKLRENSKEVFKKFRDNSKEQFEKFRDTSKEQFKKFRDNSKEQFGKFTDKLVGKFNDDSEEKSSKERFNKHKRQSDNNNNDNDDSGEWQEKYMKHREKQRKQNEQKYQANENWYIKRGDSRENKRSGEKQYR